VIERFQNPFIRHELMSIALNSISKYQVRVLPSLLEYVKRQQKLPVRLVSSLAALILFYKGEWKGEVIPLNDTPSVLSFFKKAWSLGPPGTVIEHILSNQELWGMDLTTVKGLTAEVENQLNGILEGKFNRVSPSGLNK
jgi:tagaturonate reductase